MKKISVLIVDDHLITRLGLKSLLDTCPDITVVGDAADGEEALALVAKTRPDVAIVDLMMPGMDGVETTRRIAAKHPDTRVLILTTFGTADGIGHALEAGALGALMKDAKAETLLAAVRTVADGKRSVAPQIARILRNDPPRPTLSPRQTEILGLVTQGRSNKEIAQTLSLSTAMVNEHVNAIFAKLGAANRTEAAAIALRKHLLKA